MHPSLVLQKQQINILVDRRLVSMSACQHFSLSDLHFSTLAFRWIGL